MGNSTIQKGENPQLSSFCALLSSSYTAFSISLHHSVANWLSCLCDHITSTINALKVLLLEKVLKVDNLSSSYLTIFLHLNDQLDKDQKSSMGLAARSSLVALWGALSGLVGEKTRLQWVGEQLGGELENPGNVETLKNLNYKGKKRDRVSI